MKINKLLSEIKIDDTQLIKELRKQMGMRGFLIEVLTYYDVEEVFKELNQDELKEYLEDNYGVK